MRTRVAPSLVLGLALSAAAESPAIDYWDASAANDNSASGTTNELHHGVSQQHDLETNPGPSADLDWSYVYLAPRSSYEAVVDSASGDIDPFDPAILERLDSSGTVLQQSSEAANVGAAVAANRALRFRNTTASFALNHVRVRSSGCTTNCTSAAQYRLRFFETTISVPRFNNAGGQVTILIVHNTTEWTRAVAGTIHLWNAAGTLLDSTTFSLTEKETAVLNTATLPGAAGQSGTITISHDGGYGNLAVKSVALEPQTGFSFDTPGLYKPY
jgi:hypothetical protein